MSRNAKSAALSKTFFARSCTDVDAPDFLSDNRGPNVSQKKGRGKGTQYMFRAECPGDADIVRSLLVRSLLSWHQDTCSGWPDTDVTFTVKAGGPTLEQMKWLIDQVPDCHVICESLAPAGEYTGERVWLSEQYPEGIPRPPKRVAVAALDGLEAYLESLESFTDVIQDAIEAIRPAHRARQDR